MESLYNTRAWRQLRARVLERDADCFLSGIAGACHGALHVHHIDPVSDGGEPFPRDSGLVTVCARHHRALHGFLNRQNEWKTCKHRHRSEYARKVCEARLNRAPA